MWRAKVEIRLPLRTAEAESRKTYTRAAQTVSVDYIIYENRIDYNRLKRFEQSSYVLRLSASAVRCSRQISTFARHIVVLSDP